MQGYEYHLRHYLGTSTHLHHSSFLLRAPSTSRSFDYLPSRRRTFDPKSTVTLFVLEDWSMQACWMWTQHVSHLPSDCQMGEQSSNPWETPGRQKHINVESPQCWPSERPEEYRSYRHERRDVSGMPWRRRIHLDYGIIAVEVTGEDTADERVISKFSIQPLGHHSLIYHQLQSSKLYILMPGCITENYRCGN